MSLTLNPPIPSPARIAITGNLGFRDALELVGLLERTAPESVELDVADVCHVSADAVAVLAASARQLRQSGRDVVVVNAAPLVDLYFTIVGFNDFDADPVGYLSSERD